MYGLCVVLQEGSAVAINLLFAGKCGQVVNLACEKDSGVFLLILN